MFLDEPTIGLDVVSQKTVREFLRHHNATRKTTILLTSHYMADIQELCDRVIIIDHGTIFFDGRLAEVLDRFADFKLITIQLAGGANRPMKHCDVMARWSSRRAAASNSKCRATGSSPVAKRSWTNLPVTDIDIQEIPIEDIIRKIFAR